MSIQIDRFSRNRSIHFEILTEYRDELIDRTMGGKQFFFVFE